MKYVLDSSDVFGLLRPGVDAHTLGVSQVAELLKDCQVPVVLGDSETCDALNYPSNHLCQAKVSGWVRDFHITRLGFSYRLDAQDGVRLLTEWLRIFREHQLLTETGGPLRSVYFAGLPDACQRVRHRFADAVTVFCGDETHAETLVALGIPRLRWPRFVTENTRYDESRLQFGTDLVREGQYLGLKPPDRSRYAEFGTARDTLSKRVSHARRLSQSPLLRAHVGPYLPDREEAVELYLRWGKQLATDGFLDVLSIGTSQLTQSHFGEEWGNRPNGGGVPINSAKEYREVWNNTRPMLVRTYAGTRQIPKLARLHEEALHIAWHALSLWWFCRLDGRGPYELRDNLRQHIETLRFIAASSKPFEPNVPHHFSFRGSDDVTYVATGVLAARLAKRSGIRQLVVQNMLNMPKATWGIEDLAKARAMLQLIRELEDDRFRVYYQPRAGLDYFSPDLHKARAQLAAVTALMADVEPQRAFSPDIIHVVSYSEAAFLADPAVVRESAQITLAALKEYRRLQRKGLVDDMTTHPEVVARTAELISEARRLLTAIEATIPGLYSADGLYLAFRAGFFPVPHLWTCREEFAPAVGWGTRLIRGAMRVVDSTGNPIPIETRIAHATENVARELMRPQRARLSA